MHISDRSLTLFNLEALKTLLPKFSNNAYEFNIYLFFYQSCRHTCMCTHIVSLGHNSGSNVLADLWEKTQPTNQVACQMFLDFIFYFC